MCCNGILLFLGMAKQSGAHTITGTVDNLCFYRMEGKYYVRTKSSLTGKRVKKDPVFARTMHYANLLARASVISSALYKQLAAAQKVKGFYRKITGEAMRLIKEGLTETAVAQRLKMKYMPRKRKSKAVIQPKLMLQCFTEHVWHTCCAERLTGYAFDNAILPGNPP